MSKKPVKPFEMPRLVIGAAGSGAGKTTVALGIMAALKRRGLVVQGFKCGPDYIDPGYHAAVTGRPSRNLDSWFVKPSLVKQVFANNAQDADISIVEGVMGLFDGRNPADNQGSTAEISQILQAPVLLVLDARSMARSAAAIVRGFQVFSGGTAGGPSSGGAPRNLSRNLSKKVQIAGVVANKVGSPNHLEILREAIEPECGIPLVGGILRDESLQVPERHLGLLPAIERGELLPLFEILADAVEKSLDLDLILKIAGYQKKTPVRGPGARVSGARVLSRRNAFPENRLYVIVKKHNPVKVAVARDAAFNFYYPENLEVMRQAGMEPIFFSPLKNEPVPQEAGGLYLGGGFPEEFAGLLSKNRVTIKSVRQVIENSMPAIAECGGYMYLAREIVDRKGKSRPMAGIFPGRVVMKARRAALGYREISGLANNFFLGPGETIRGHEFHYSEYEPAETGKADNVIFAPAYHMRGRNIDGPAGHVYKNLVAGYAHFYFLSNTEPLIRWAQKCREYALKA